MFVRNRRTGTTTRVNLASNGSQANGFSGSPGISRHGHDVVFFSFASNLVPGDTNEWPMCSAGTGPLTKSTVGVKGGQRVMTIEESVRVRDNL
jgi:hypothetical protein